VAAGLTTRGYAVSSSGTIVYLEGAASVGVLAVTPTHLLVFDPAGKVDTLHLPEGRRLRARYSPDGHAIAFEFVDPIRTPATDIYTFDLVTGTATQITFDGDNDAPVWSPDGTRLLFDVEASTRDSTQGADLFVKPADNSENEKRVLSRAGDQVPWAWLPDDRIVFASDDAGNRDLFTLSLSKQGEPQPYLEAPWDEYEFALSPDGKLAAFVSRETQTPDVWVRDFPTPEGKWRVSSGGGRDPRWSPDGRTLYFWRIVNGPAPDTLLAVRIDRQPRVTVRQPQVVLVVNNNAQGWDVSPDGSHFLVAEPYQPANTAAAGSGPEHDRYLVVLNWFEELKQRMAAK
jgi:eukaryotic-like serine/threonine-protein kinase